MGSRHRAPSVSSTGNETDVRTLAAYGWFQSHRDRKNRLVSITHGAKWLEAAA